MANFLVFVLVFAAQLIGGLSIPRLPPPTDEDTISILSIDGGGIKGIIPARVLQELDEALKAKDPDSTLAHYFDVIAGTSTGGLITAMLASPSPTNANTPAFTPQKIVQFYHENGPKIFANSSLPIGPQYDWQLLQSIIRELLQEKRLDETLTNVVIPTFDMKTQKPVLFSSYKVERVPYLNAKLSDISIGTSAAPTQFMPHFFINDFHFFNLVDGALAANNPARAAVSEVIQHNNYSKIQVLSLGTGSVNKDKYNLDAIVGALLPADEWLGLGVVYLASGTTAMNDHYLSHVYDGYLRIEEYDLPDSLSDTANATKENLDGLEEVGKELLQKNVLKRNLDTFDLEETGEGTNAEALHRLADFLYEERQKRLSRSNFMGKGGRPFLQTLRNPSGQI